jgi:ankyrin repeat protein
LYIAVESKNSELIEYLAKRSSSCSISLNIALEMAVWTSLWDLIPCLLDSGANVNAQNMGGLTALHRAAGLGEFNVAVYLLNKRANINKKDFYGITPLFYAAFNGHWHMVELLVQNGASVRHRDKAGNTVLHCAASFRNVYVMRYLVMYLFSHKAADVLWMKNKRMMTALDVAIKKKNVRVKNYLETLNARGEGNTRPLNCKKFAQYVSSNCYVQNKGTESYPPTMRRKNTKQSDKPFFSEEEEKVKTETKDKRKN